MNLQNIGGRKFLLTLLTQLLATALISFSKLDANTYMLITLGITGVFIGGNVVEKKHALDAEK